MKPTPPFNNVDDETAVTDIEIAADGRVYVFGASLAVLEILEELTEHDERLQRRIAAARAGNAAEQTQPIGHND